MNRIHRFAGVPIAVLALLATACGNSTEKGVEELIERQTDGSVDVDIGDGTFRVETEDGSLIFDDEGNFTAVGEDGEVVTGNIDSDSGAVDIESSGDEGDVSFQSGTGIPEEWPAEVPVPPGLTDVTGSSFSDGQQSSVLIVASLAADLGAFAEDYTNALEAAGYTEVDMFEFDGSFSTVLENERWVVTVTGTPMDGGPNQVSITVTPAS